MELIEHHKLQVGCTCVHEGELIRAGEHQLEHHIVGEEDMGRILLDRPLLSVTLLTGVAGKAHWSIGHTGEEALDRLRLRVDQSIHRVDNDGTNAPILGLMGQHMVHNRDDVGQALPRTSARSHHIVLASCSEVDSPLLVAKEVQRT